MVDQSYSKGLNSFRKVKEFSCLNGILNTNKMKAIKVKNSMIRGKPRTISNFTTQSPFNSISTPLRDSKTKRLNRFKQHSIVTIPDKLNISSERNTSNKFSVAWLFSKSKISNENNLNAYIGDKKLMNITATPIVEIDNSDYGWVFTQRNNKSTIIRRYMNH